MNGFVGNFKRKITRKKQYADKLYDFVFLNVYCSQVCQTGLAFLAAALNILLSIQIVYLYQSISIGLLACYSVMIYELNMYKIVKDEIIKY